MPTPITLQPTGQRLLVPTRWADVTLDQYLLLHGCAEPDDERSAAEVLLGLNAHALDQLAAQDVPLIATLISFVQDASDVEQLLPPPGLPDVGQLPWGCLVLVQQYVAANPDRPDLYYYPYVLSVYRTQLLWGKVEEVRRAACEAALRVAPVTEVYAEALAFWRGCRQLSNGTSPTRQTTTSPATRSRRPTPTRRWLSDLGLRFNSTP